MTDLANLPRKSIPKYVSSVFDNIDSFDIDYDGNYAAMLSLSATVCLINFITVSQPYCKKNHLILDEDFINEKIGDLNFVRKLFNNYEADGGEEKDKLRYFDLSLQQHRPEASHKFITNVTKRAFQNCKVSESV